MDDLKSEDTKSLSPLSLIVYLLLAVALYFLPLAADIIEGFLSQPPLPIMTTAGETRYVHRVGDKPLRAGHISLFFERIGLSFNKIYPFEPFYRWGKVIF